MNNSHSYPQKRTAMQEGNQSVPHRMLLFPEAMVLLLIQAGLLTYSFFDSFPSAWGRTVDIVVKKSQSLQHRVMSGIFTRFPFHLCPP